jgi:hypothetical protein
MVAWLSVHFRQLLVLFTMKTGQLWTEARHKQHWSFARNSRISLENLVAANEVTQATGRITAPGTANRGYTAPGAANRAFQARCTHGLRRQAGCTSI